MPDLSQNQIERFTESDIRDTRSFILKLNSLLSFLASRVARIEGVSDRDVRLNRTISVPSVRTDSKELPKSDDELINWGQAKKAFSPQVTRDSISRRRWVDGTRVQPFAARSVDGATGYLSGTHADKLLVDAGSQTDGTIFYETDRTTYYIARSGSWRYYFGVMEGDTASRPSDLGTSDEGFRYGNTTTLTYQLWDGSAWDDEQIPTVDSTGSVRAQGNTATTYSGSGVEVAFSGGSGFVLAYDRTGAAYEPLAIRGDPLALNDDGGGPVYVGANADDGSGSKVQVTGSINTSEQYKVDGTQVVTNRQADAGTAASSPVYSLTTTAQVADGVYSANEQTMLGELKTGLTNANTAIDLLKAQIDNLITDRDRLRTVLQAHGLMS
jgi:hypothetical protein